MLCFCFALSDSLKRARGGRDARPCYIALASRLGLGIMPKASRSPHTTSSKSKPRRSGYRTCNCGDVDEDVEAWGSCAMSPCKMATLQKSRSSHKMHRPKRTTVEGSTLELQQTQKERSTCTHCRLFLLVLLLATTLLGVAFVWIPDPSDRMEHLLGFASTSIYNTPSLPPPSSPNPSRPRPSCPPVHPPTAPPPTWPPPPSHSPCPPGAPLSPPSEPPPCIPPPMLPPAPPPPPPGPPPLPYPPGFTVLPDLNAQFRTARVTNNLATSGVLVHVYDGISDVYRPWLPCTDPSCEVYGDRFATSLLYPGHQDVYAGGAGGWQKGGGGGFVLRASELTVNCAYYADGGSQGKVCARGDDNCIPGCGRWCDPGRGVFNWGCAWKPEHLKQMIVQQMQVHPDGGYNEIIIDASSWVAHLPRTIAAVFVCVDENGMADPEKVQHSREVHRRFLEDYKLSSVDFPLLLFDEKKTEPFRMMPDDYRGGGH